MAGAGCEPPGGRPVGGVAADCVPGAGITGTTGRAGVGEGVADGAVALAGRTVPAGAGITGTAFGAVGSDPC